MDVVLLTEYLRRTYHPDREFVEGVLLERNWGELDHAETQGNVYFFVRMNCPLFWAVPEARVQVRPDRFRIPDVAIMRGARPEGRMIVSPLEVAVEVLSPDDRAAAIEAKVADYLEFGTSCVWVIDPEARSAFMHTSEGSHEVTDGMLRNPAGDLSVPVAACFRLR